MSATFEWLLKAPPDPRVTEQLGEVVRLGAALEADGWEEVDPGLDWYARRFVWRHDAPPPDTVGGAAE